MVLQLVGAVPQESVQRERKSTPGYDDESKGFQTKAHRHVHSAIYHVVDGQGYTVIDGQKFEWKKGDFFILPPWSYHEYVNTGQQMHVNFHLMTNQ